MMAALFCCPENYGEALWQKNSIQSSTFISRNSWYFPLTKMVKKKCLGKKRKQKSFKHGVWISKIQKSKWQSGSRFLSEPNVTTILTSFGGSLFPPRGLKEWSLSNSALVDLEAESNPIPLEPCFRSWSIIIFLYSIQLFYKSFQVHVFFWSANFMCQKPAFSAAIPVPLSRSFRAIPNLFVSPHTLDSFERCNVEISTPKATQLGATCSLKVGQVTRMLHRSDIIRVLPGLLAWSKFGNLWTLKLRGMRGWILSLHFPRWQV